MLTASIAAFFFVDVSSAISNDVQGDLENSAEDEAEILSEWIKEEQQTARMLSSYQAVQEGDGEEIKAALSAELAEIPEETHGIHYVYFET